MPIPARSRIQLKNENAPDEEMTGLPLAPSVQLPLLPSGPGGIHGLQSRGPGHHAIWRTQCGGESGIRTHGTLPHTRFPSEHLRPLGHPSLFTLLLALQRAERVGFEPTVGVNPQ